jgi:SCY1-like protein 1
MQQGGGGGAQGSAVTVFIANFTSSSASGGGSGGASAIGDEMLRNVQRRARGFLMLPGMLRCYDAVEYNDKLFIATDPCVPLRRVLAEPALRRFFYAGYGAANTADKEEEEDEEEERCADAIAFGAYTVASAVASLHKNKICHAGVHVDSVFVLTSGEWRLFGLEAAGNDSIDDGSLTRRAITGSRMLAHRVAPEIAAGSASVFPGSSNGGVYLDAWGLAALLYESYNPTVNTSALTAADLRAAKNVPRALHSVFSNLVAPNAKSRWTVERFVAEGRAITENRVVRALRDLEEIALRDATDRDNFYRDLASVVRMLPVRLARCVVLPKLTTALQYGGSSAAALAPLMEVGKLLPEADFGDLIAPSVLALFGSPEPLVRSRLLEGAEHFAGKLPPTLVAEKIWPLYITSFQSRHPEMRELAVRALIHFAPSLSQKFADGDVLRWVLQMQQDQQAPIRANATVCLSLLTSYIPVEGRARALVSGFGRMLKDPFPPSRMAAVRGFGGIADLPEPTTVAEQILPALCPLLLDSSHDVRESCAAAVSALLARLRAHAQTMPVGESTAAALAGASGAPTVTVGPSAGISGTTNGTSNATGASTSQSAAATPVGVGGSSHADPASKPPATTSAAPIVRRGFGGASAGVASTTPAAAAATPVRTPTATTATTAVPPPTARTAASVAAGGAEPAGSSLARPVSSAVQAPASDDGWGNGGSDDDDDWGTTTTASAKPTVASAPARPTSGVMGAGPAAAPSATISRPPIVAATVTTAPRSMPSSASTASLNGTLSGTSTLTDTSGAPITTTIGFSSTTSGMRLGGTVKKRGFGGAAAFLKDD